MEIGNMNIAMISFILFAIIVGTGGTYSFYSSGRTVGALLFFIGAIAVFVFYGIRWFEGKNALGPEAPVNWPPYINTCPDFLTYYKRKTSTGLETDTCVDRIGVSRNSKLAIFPASGNVSNDDDKYFFPLKTDSEDPARKRAQLCARTIDYGLTWEGVTDGETCFSPENTGTAIATSSAGGAAATCA
jgi:hypothetical protein